MMDTHFFEYCILIDEIYITSVCVRRARERVRETTVPGGEYCASYCLLIRYCTVVLRFYDLYINM